MRLVYTSRFGYDDVVFFCVDCNSLVFAEIICFQLKGQIINLRLLLLLRNNRCIFFSSQTVYMNGKICSGLRGKCFIAGDCRLLSLT